MNTPDESFDGKTIDITPSLVQRLIASQFPEWGSLTVTRLVPGGWDNRTFRLGHDMSVRLPSAQRYAAQVKKEQRWLPFLGKHLPLSIPVPLREGSPDANYPFNWSIFEWIEGSPIKRHTVNLNECALSLARFLNALRKAPSQEGPPAGKHNFYRGGTLTHYDNETRQALGMLKDDIEVKKALSLWETAITTHWQKASVWVHGDISPGNLLEKEGKLSAVIDFGCCGTGDPACDISIAWTFFSGESRKTFLKALALDKETIYRAKGWALWKALILLSEHKVKGTSRDREGKELRSLIQDLLTPDN